MKIRQQRETDKTKCNTPQTQYTTQQFTSTHKTKAIKGIHTTRVQAEALA